LILKGENFKNTIFIKNQIHPFLGFCPNANHFAARFSIGTNHNFFDCCLYNAFYLP